VTGIRFATQGEVSIHPEKNPVLKLLRRFLPVTEDFEQEHLFVRRNARWHATPLFVVLLLIESSDVVFAVDSIPAIFAITRDPFIVYSSNVLAILGLRALYFLLAAVMPMFRYLNEGLGVVLGFVGVKMLLADVYHIPVLVSLGVVAVVLAASLLLSVWAARRARKSV
jgi:tellurite resistance protein TerC